MSTDSPALAGDAREGWKSSPPCTECGAETAPVATMQRHTVDADPWFHCEVCGNVFTSPDDE
jgi:DNA-directed RNA polymerase subunit M/transcription elongation factor TFIIS